LGPRHGEMNRDFSQPKQPSNRDSEDIRIKWLRGADRPQYELLRAAILLRGFDIEHM
jgi:hypothetical protein